MMTSASVKKTFWTKDYLLNERGWSERLIHQFLGDPDWRCTCHPEDGRYNKKRVRRRENTAKYTRAKFHELHPKLQKPKQGKRRQSKKIGLAGLKKWLDENIENEHLTEMSVNETGSFVDQQTIMVIKQTKPFVWDWDIPTSVIRSYAKLYLTEMILENQPEHKEFFQERLSGLAGRIPIKYHGSDPLLTSASMA